MSRDNGLEMINCGIVVLEAAIVVAGSVNRNLELTSRVKRVRVRNAVRYSANLALLTS